MTGNPPASDTNYAHFTFSTGFVHGLDGTYITPASTGTTMSHMGKLRKFSVPLNAYAGQTVFLAFHHNSFDDNLISIDDILVRSLSSTVGVSEKRETGNGLVLYPNPATDKLFVGCSALSPTELTVYDVLGQSVLHQNLESNTNNSTINISMLSPGVYSAEVKTAEGILCKKFIKTR